MSALPQRGKLYHHGQLVGEVVAVDWKGSPPVVLGVYGNDAPAVHLPPVQRSGSFGVHSVHHTFTRALARWIQDQQEGVTMYAPTNPYRRHESMEGGMRAMAGMPGMHPRTAAPERGGPGLSAADLDTLVRQHYVDGHAAAEREAAERYAELQAKLPDAYDEGFAAGRLDRAAGLANDFRVRIAECDMLLRDAEQGPKTKIPGHLALLRDALDEVRAFALAMTQMSDPKVQAQALAVDASIRHEGV